MKQLLRLSLFACTGLLLLLNSSCTFQKRLYRPGFFVQANAGKPERKAGQVSVQQQSTDATVTTQTASVNKTTDAETLPVVRETSTSSAAKTTPAVQTTKQDKKEVRKAERQSRRAIKQLVKKKTAVAADKPIHQYIVGSCVCLALGIIGGLLLLSSIGSATTLSGAAGLLLLGFACIVIGVLGAFGLSAAGLVKLKMGDDANFGGYLLGLIMLGLSILLGTGIVFLFAD
jgi:hypothetical protein